MPIFPLNIMFLDKGNVFYAVGTKFCNTAMSVFNGLIALHINSMNCWRLRFNC